MMNVKLRLKMAKLTHAIIIGYSFLTKRGSEILAKYRMIIKFIKIPFSKSFKKC